MKMNEWGPRETGGRTGGQATDGNKKNWPLMTRNSEMYVPTVSIKSIISMEIGWAAALMDKYRTCQKVVESQESYLTPIVLWKMLMQWFFFPVLISG
jgi:hypothetical protein